VLYKQNTPYISDGHYQKAEKPTWALHHDGENRGKI